MATPGSTSASGSGSNELDTQLRAVGVNKEQRKRLIAASRLGGIPNPLKQLGLREPPARSRSRSPRRAVAFQTALEAPPVPAAGQSTLTLAVAAGGGQRPVRTPASRPASRSSGKEEDDPDLDSFLAGGRAIMAKAKAMGQARREQAAREQVESTQRQQRDQEAAMEQQKRLQEEQRRREAEEQERRKEEERREARKNARKEEKMRRKEQKKRQREEEEGGEELEEDDEDSPQAPPRLEDEEAERRRRAGAPQKGFFSQAFKGNQQQRALWSQPIKGHVSNNYRGTSDADLERRFRLLGAQSAGEKLMTEEEVLAMLRNRKTK